MAPPEKAFVVLLTDMVRDHPFRTVHSVGVHLSEWSAERQKRELEKDDQCFATITEVSFGGNMADPYTEAEQSRFQEMFPRKVK